MRALIVMRHPDHFFHGALFVANGKSECHLRAHFRTGIALRQFLQHPESGLFSCFTEPEGGLLSHRFGLARSRERSKSPVSPRVFLQRTSTPPTMLTRNVH